MNSTILVPKHTARLDELGVSAELDRVPKSLLPGAMIPLADIGSTAPIHVPSFRQTAESVLQQDRKNANINASSGAILGIE